VFFHGRTEPNGGPPVKRQASSSAPPPTLPVGAGGPLWRAAGRAGPAADGAACGLRAAIVEHDALLRLQVEQAVRALGFRPAVGDEEVAATFVGLDEAGLPCGGRPAARSRRGGVRVGYAARAVSLLAAHRLHRCCTVLLELRPGPGGPVFVHPSQSLLEPPALTPREADVLLLVVSGFTTDAVAATLCVAPATARSHCRAVLRKMGVADRRGLRRLLLPAAVLPAAPPRGAGSGSYEPRASNTSPVSSLG
jgi:DNA-binding CsgD family transcriptional regulator